MNGKLNLGVLEEELYENLMKARDKLKSHHGKGNKRRNFNQNKRQVLIFGPITLLNPKIGHKFKVKDHCLKSLKEQVWPQEETFHLVDGEIPNGWCVFLYPVDKIRFRLLFGYCFCFHFFLIYSCLGISSLFLL